MPHAKLQYEHTLNGTKFVAHLQLLHTEMSRK